jgi:hypothetical protein
VTGAASEAVEELAPGAADEDGAAEPPAPFPLDVDEQAAAVKAIAPARKARRPGSSCGSGDSGGSESILSGNACSFVRC